MRKKFNLLFITLFISFLCSNISIAKPRCELFYEEVYNQTSYPRDVDYISHGNQKDIGFRLYQKINESQDDFVLRKNSDGYYLVGKLTQEKFVGFDPYDFTKIMVGDAILEINNEDIRTSFDEKKYSKDIAEMFEESENVLIKFSRKLPDGEFKTFEIESKVKITSYNNPSLDILVENIKPNEKEGTYIIALSTDYTEYLTKEYNITKVAHKNLIRAEDRDEYPTNEEIENEQFDYEECTFSENDWERLNSRDPNYGVKVKNVVYEDNTKRYANYLVIPFFHDYESDNNSKETIVSYKKRTSYEIKNDFNLKSFPFDKQKIILQIENERYSLDEWKAGLTTWTLIQLNEFAKENQITGWDITNYDMSYKSFYNPFYGDIGDGFEVILEIERKSGYYIFKIILPIVLILMVCWSVVWISPKELESRLTITIVCLLSLIAYNFVIDKDLPKLEYLTVLDWLILISYVYATIPNFLSILSFSNINKRNKFISKLDFYGKKYGALSYVLIVIIIISANANLNPDYTSSALGWLTYAQK